MTRQRLQALCASLVFLFGIVLCRVLWIATDTGYAVSAGAQTVATAELPRNRGDFFDCNGRRLTGEKQIWYALCIPGDSSYANLFPYVPYEQQNDLYENRNSASPFLVPVSRDLSANGIYTYPGRQRYLDNPVAVHLIGYLDGEGNGVSGLELAFDDLLAASADEQAVSCATTAQGSLLAGTLPDLETQQQGSGLGVQLTLNVEIQRACEGIAQTTMDTGCILVADVTTGRVFASVSMPEFDPRNIQKSIDANDTSLINRAFAAFSAGSVFKVVLAAAAYEAGLDWFTHDCTGSIQVSDQTYRCALGRAHGTVNLRGALEQSCNCYFVALGQALGGQLVADMAERFGFGRATAVAGGLKSGAGTLPDAETLKNAGQLAMFSFGQGELTVTPVQITAMMRAVAGDGRLLPLSFVQGPVDSKTMQPAAQSTTAPVSRSDQVCSGDTARILRSMLQSVVTDGIGGEAAPTWTTAGGKTGTAQTGQFNAQGEELLNYWFSGFVPAENPRYVITVLQDATLDPETSSPAIFARVADALHALDEAGTQTPESAEKLPALP
ncbi:penicillin-binding protein 2 [uncultured Gemmiger sp.]|uniref:peptidoglycan D,D-transpeptidase FtsI family protein n=1 Tax=uncultured Gemmiger sp. TaxID=1623490 RepID=UPI0025FF3A3C|nr:penicillin-binding protein 2 [uncultured Gemmiger sp.]